MITCQVCFTTRDAAQQFCESLTCKRRATSVVKVRESNPKPKWAEEEEEINNKEKPLMTGKTTGGGIRVIRGTRNLS